MARRKNRNEQVVFCPACDGLITFKKSPKRGNRVTCRDCDSLLRVVSVQPLEMTWAFEEPFERDDRSSRRNWVADTANFYDEYNDYMRLDEEYRKP